MLFPNRRENKSKYVICSNSNYNNTSAVSTGKYGDCLCGWQL